MKSRFLIPVLFILSVIIIIGCKTAADVPEDHSVNKGGVMHKTGLTDPEANCVACHGADLRGSGNVSSCYSCHNKNW